MAKNLKNKKKHLSNEERFCIEKMLGVGDSLSHIGRTLGRGLSTISEEVSENGGREKYKAEKAIHRAYLKQYRKKRNCNGVALDSHSSAYVEKRLRGGLSPEAISARTKIQSGLAYRSPKSIRKFIRSRGGLERYLFWNRTNMKTGRKRGNNLFLSDPARKWIDTRPWNALYEYGHWEMDFIVSKHNSYVLLVCVEKYSKLLKLRILPNRNNDLVNQAVCEMTDGYTRTTITTDNDIAFSKWPEMERMLDSKIYFCHPYHSWEKGLVENSNRWIREFIPKKTDLKSIDERFLLQIEEYFNHKPRVCLEGRTSYEVMMQMEYGTMVESLEINFPNVRIWG